MLREVNQELNCYSLVGFSQKHLQFVFTYGPGLFRQQNVTDMSENMHDFVFVVDDTTSGHQENITANPSHYSFMHRIGPKRVDSGRLRRSRILQYTSSDGRSIC